MLVQVKQSMDLKMCFTDWRNNEQRVLTPSDYNELTNRYEEVCGVI